MYMYALYLLPKLNGTCTSSQLHPTNLAKILSQLNNPGNKIELDNQPVFVSFFWSLDIISLCCDIDKFKPKLRVPSPREAQTLFFGGSIHVFTPLHRHDRQTSPISINTCRSFLFAILSHRR